MKYPAGIFVVVKIDKSVLYLHGNSKHPKQSKQLSKRKTELDLYYLIPRLILKL